MMPNAYHLVNCSNIESAMKGFPNEGSDLYCIVSDGRCIYFGKREKVDEEMVNVTHPKIRMKLSTFLDFGILATKIK